MDSFIHRIEVHYKSDPRLKSRTDRIRSLGFPIERTAPHRYLYHRDGLAGFFKGRARTNRRTTHQPRRPGIYHRYGDTADFDYAIEVGFLPGVTDNVGTTARQTIEDFFSMRFWRGNRSTLAALFCMREPVSGLTAETRLNPCKSSREPGAYEDPAGIREHGAWTPSCRRSTCMNCRRQRPLTSILMTRNLPGSEKRGSWIQQPGSGGDRLPLTLPSCTRSAIILKRKGRKPTDVELESLAQTWSEHCKHTIFASAMDDDVPDGLYKTYIQAATNRIRKEKGEKGYLRDGVYRQLRRDHL